MMRKLLLYGLAAVTVAFSGWAAFTLYRMLFCYAYDDWNAYPVVSLFLLVGLCFVVYAALAVICLLAATLKGGLEE